MRRRLPLLLFLLASACVSRSLREDERIRHERALAGHEDGVLYVVELRAADDDPPLLRLLAVAEEIRELRRDEGEAASAVLAAREADEPLLAAARPWLEGATFPKIEAEDVSLPLELKGALQGLRVERRPGGIALVGRGFATTLHPFVGEPQLAVHRLRDEDAAVPLLAASLRFGDGAFAVSDVARLDLAAGAAALHRQAAEAYLPRDPRAALMEVAKGRFFGEDGGALAFVEARARALGREPVALVMEALEEAIRHDASRYRMYARMVPDFAPYRANAAFADLVAPRPLDAGDERSPARSDSRIRRTAETERP